MSMADMHLAQALFQNVLQDGYGVHLRAPDFLKLIREIHAASAEHQSFGGDLLRSFNRIPFPITPFYDRYHNAYSCLARRVARKTADTRLKVHVLKRLKQTVVRYWRYWKTICESGTIPADQKNIDSLTIAQVRGMYDWMSWEFELGKGQAFHTRHESKAKLLGIRGDQLTKFYENEHFNPDLIVKFPKKHRAGLGADQPTARPLTPLPNETGNRLPTSHIDTEGDFGHALRSHTAHSPLAGPEKQMKATKELAQPREDGTVWSHAPSMRAGIHSPIDRDQTSPESEGPAIPDPGPRHRNNSSNADSPVHRSSAHPEQAPNSQQNRTTNSADDHQIAAVAANETASRQVDNPHVDETVSDTILSLVSERNLDTRTRLDAIKAKRKAQKEQTKKLDLYLAQIRQIEKAELEIQEEQRLFDEMEEENRRKRAKLAQFDELRRSRPDGHVPQQ